MNNAATPRPTADRVHGRRTSSSEQLTLIPVAEIHPRFRLSHDTRERGMRHIAEIRERLAQHNPAA
jgi:hypothetical protein